MKNDPVEDNTGLLAEIRIGSSQMYKKKNESLTASKRCGKNVVE